MHPPFHASIHSSIHSMYPFIHPFISHFIHAYIQLTILPIPQLFYLPASLVTLQYCPPCYFPCLYVSLLTADMRVTFCALINMALILSVCIRHWPHPVVIFIAVCTLVGGAVSMVFAKPPCKDSSSSSSSSRNSSSSRGFNSSNSDSVIGTCTDAEAKGQVQMV